MLVAITFGLHPARLASFWNTVASAGVLHEEQHVRVGRLQPLHLGGQRGGAGLRREVEHHLVARLGRQLAGHLAVVLAEQVVAGEERDGLQIRGAALVAPLLEEGEDAGDHRLVVGAGAEEPLEALLGQRRRGAGVARHRQAALSTTRLDERGDAARPLAVDPVDLVHGDELLDDRARLLAAALIVAHDELDGRAAEPGNPLPGPERHLEVRVVVVDDVLGRLRRPQVLLPVVGEGAGQRQHRADEDLGDFRLGRAPGRDTPSTATASTASMVRRPK